MSRARRQSYRLGRVLGDVEAAQRGPVEYAKRRARRVVYRHVGRTTRSLLRALGLSR